MFKYGISGVRKKMKEKFRGKKSKCFGGEKKVKIFVVVKS